MKFLTSACTFAIVVTLAAATQVTPAPDPCAQYATCTVCLRDPSCGWCSEPVSYPGNITGAQCAGVSNDGPDPFTCNGIFSTDTCYQGYTCNPVNWTCEITTPGDGMPLPVCEANCTNTGAVYVCNTTTKKCHEVPPGTSGSSSLSVCEAACSSPSPHPSPPTPPSPPTALWACNYSIGECESAPAGKGSSKEVCEASCKKQTGTQYRCNTFLEQCVKVPFGYPDSMSLKKCEEVCTPHPTPGPPPAFLGGMWRGIEIQNGYTMGEWDMSFTQTLAVIVDIFKAETIKGIPMSVTVPNGVQLWINVTSGTGAGQVIKMYGEPDNRGPETNYMSASMSVPGGNIPATINAAMTQGGGVRVFGLMQCVGTPECVFTMPNGAKRRRIGHKHPAGSQRRLLAALSGAEPAEEIDMVALDPCSAFGDSCADCISHPRCGWCSENVTYHGGVKGTQCAGFSTNPNSTNKFVCQGRFSTDSCTQGYDCTAQGQCIPDPVAGNGIPLAVCQQICRATQTPAPIHGMYVCNVTSKQCYKCNETFCPGAMPKTTCEASCVKPKPGPSALVKGYWRGLEIQNGYPLGEFDLAFNASAVTAYKDGTITWTGSLTSYGGDVMIIDVLTGKNAGKTFSGIYTVADQGAMYEWMTLGMSGPNGPLPQSYAAPMQTPGDVEFVLAKCLMAPCVFTLP